jgi:hypothetical protein
MKMSKPIVYQLIKLPNGQIVKRPVKFEGTQKIERRMIQDTESRLWLYKNKYEYLDKKNADKKA